MTSLKSDGLIGLSPNKGYRKRTGLDSSHIFIYELQKDGIIDDAIFSFQLGKFKFISWNEQYETPSKVEFGGWSQDIVDRSMKNPDRADRGIVWIDLDSNWSWHVKVYATKFNDD